MSAHEPQQIVEAIRRRPGMYIGGVDALGVDHMLAITIDCLAVSHDVHITHQSRRCMSITIPGAPFTADELKHYLTTLGDGPDIPPTHFLCVVAALSQQLDVEVIDTKQKQLSRIRLVEGVLQTSEHTKITSDIRPTTGQTSLTFSLSDEIFESHLKFSDASTIARLDELSGLTGRRYSLDWGQPYTFSHKTLALYLAENVTLTETAQHIFRDMGDGLVIDIAFGHAQQTGIIKSWVNTVPTVWGTHEDGLKEGLAACFGDIEHIAAYIHVYHPRAEYENPTKSALHNPEIRDMVQALILDHMQ